MPGVIRPHSVFSLLLASDQQPHQTQMKYNITFADELVSRLRNGADGGFLVEPSKKYVY
jgi:hypothetical protein